MIKHTFEDFLVQKHAEQYIGTKDCMVDDFSSWLQELSVDDFITYGDQFAKEQSAELLEVCKNTLRQLEQVYEKGNPQTEGLCLSIRGLKGVIAKAEGTK